MKSSPIVAVSFEATKIQDGRHGRKNVQEQQKEAVVVFLLWLLRLSVKAI